MRINMHDRTPLPKTSKFIKFLLGFGLALVCGMFVMLAFVVIYYAQDIFAGIFILLGYIILGIVIVVPIMDMQRSYVEVLGEKIRIVDFYFFWEKEKLINLSEVGDIKIILASSMKLRGRRMNLTGMRYIVFYNKEGKYLFKMLETPEAIENSGKKFYIRENESMKVS